MPKAIEFDCRAFTLIELLIVVAIIGILAAIAVPNFLNAQVKAHVARVSADHQAIITALEQFNIDNNSYPPSSHSANDNLGFRRLTSPVSYINSILEDPFKKKYQSNRGNEYDVTYEFNTGRYVNSRIAGTPGNGGNNRGDDASRLNVYEVESLGPDRYDDFNSSFYPSHNPEFQFYDPSNGIVSKGDILKAGGIYLPRWYRERKGGPNTTGNNWL